ncbi:alpha/beta fold hydrolase [Pararhodobacter sp. SW119]|uniref:alpha/beta fold hydrolase n=1 Tax=Pararhodobacter sp. SW119 TaxID=2780075 RepID=UPI001AE07112|nr:alpha/beta fold hydrolase [Pararhodobacter sp. SW119]
MIVQSADAANPVLLFLHGGPGMPEFFLNGTHPTGLERDFTVVWWDQRGAGLSFDPGLQPESMTFEHLIADTVAVADYLRDRFGQDRIVLLGHSWGSFLGLLVAARAPDRFRAYVGMAQAVHQLRSETLAHAAMLAAYRARGDAAMVGRLEAAPVSMELGLSDDYMRLRDPAMHGLGVGTTRDMRSVITGVFLPVWREPAYTVREKVSVWRGLRWSRRHLWDEFLATDLGTRIDRLEIPFYLLIGRHDLTANPELARALFERIEAPLKGFYTFENSAHSPLFEEPERARQILREDVLTGRAKLADKLR